MMMVRVIVMADRVSVPRSLKWESSLEDGS